MGSAEPMDGSFLDCSHPVDTLDTETKAGSQGASIPGPLCPMFLGRGERDTSGADLCPQVDQSV